MRDQNPAHVYRDVAKKIVAKLKENLLGVIETGKSPDLYWKLEAAIIDAMKYADSVGAARTQGQIDKIVTDFETNDGSSSQ